MKGVWSWTIAGWLFLGVPLAGIAQAAGPLTETVVFLRHGEKPDGGLGQLDCQGLNRALALPSVLVGKFGRAAAVFAPNPAARKIDSLVSYDYVRPLATIEPTAVALGLPVDTTFAYDDSDGLLKALQKPELQGRMVFVAWEHRVIDLLAKGLLKANQGDPDQVPGWKGDDFDSLYVVRIVHDGGAVTATFSKDAQGLNGQSKVCPGYHE